MRDITVAITAASYSGNKGAAAMLQSSIGQLHEKYGDRLNVNLMSVYPGEDKEQLPWDFITVVPCTPEKLLFIAFPLAILYWLFRWCPPVKALLLKNKILKAYSQTDIVIDEAGISFVDSRGFVMNTYAFVCAAVPLLVGTSVVKYSQAMGTFKNGWNRFLAKWILPKLKLVIARGQGTLDNLTGIGITDNVKLCADGAFTMPDNDAWTRKVAERWESDPFFNDRVVGLSISSVVNKKCNKLGIDYKSVMVSFIEYLTGRGYGVFLIANAARIHSEKPRNNDLMIGDAIYEAVSDKTNVRWFHEEMDAEEIREHISRCKFLVASRFHAMIGALEKEVPVLLVGWSHKYQEVLDMFELGQYAADFSKLSLDELKQSFAHFEADEAKIREKLSTHHDAVLASSRNNIIFISEIIDELNQQTPKKKPEEKEMKTDSGKNKWSAKKVLKLIGNAISLLSVLFVIRAIIVLGFDFSHIENWATFLGVVLISVLIKTVTVYISGTAWYGWLAFFTGKKDQLREAVVVYAKANIGKYLPGNVMHYVERNLFADKLGMKQKQLAAATLLEIMTLVTVAFLMSVLFSASQVKMALQKIFGEQYLFVVCAVVLAGFLCVIAFCILFRKKMRQILEERSIKAFVLTVLRNMCLNGSVLFSLGAVMVILYCYMGGAFTWSSAMLIVSGFVIAWVLGFVVPGAPGGIGVRELVITLLLGSVMGEGMVVTLSVTHRLITIIGDFLAYVLRLALVERKPAG